MIVLRVSTEGALPSGFPDVFWGLGRMLPNKRSEETARAVSSRFASVYKHLPCLPVVRPSFFESLLYRQNDLTLHLTFFGRTDYLCMPYRQKTVLKKSRR